MEYINLEDDVPKNFTGLAIKYEKTGGKFKGRWKQGKFWEGTYTFYEIKYISGERYQEEFIIPYKNGMGKSCDARGSQPVARDGSERHG